MKLASLLLVTVLAACGPTPSEMAKEVSTEVVYFKDYRVGLCFALWKDSGNNAASVTIANVPCSQVERVIVNKRPPAEAPTAP